MSHGGGSISGRTRPSWSPSSSAVTYTPAQVRALTPVRGRLVHDQPEDRGAGVSAKGLQRVLELGSYQTAWTILHKYRSAMVRPGRDLLTGIVEVDETLVGGTKHGAAGRGALGKTLVAVAVEVHDPRGCRACRLQVIPDAPKPTLSGFVTDTIDPGATWRTDGWLSCRGLESLGYTHEAVNVSASGEPAHVSLPGGPPGRVAAQRLPAVPQAALAGVLQRVGVPLQPSALAGSRDAVLPANGAGRVSRAAALLRPDPIRASP